MAFLTVIRRWALRDKLPIREIARRTGISRNTIKKYLREGIVEPAFQTPDRPSKLDPYAAQLTGWLISDQRKSRKERRTAKLWKMQSLGGARKAMAIFKARIARSRFMRLLTAQPITRRECRSRMTARNSAYDSLWVRVEPQLPGKVGDTGVTAQNNRLFLEALFWRVRTGSPWRDLPSHFGNWNSQFRRFRRWAKSGVFENLFKAMSDGPDLEYALIDGTIVQVHQKASGAKGGLKLMPLDVPAED
jgi:transposase/transcriptional regulator with XRE-family HTH domain